MRIAVSLGTLRIPPTYFAIQHTRLLVTEHTIRTFALTTDIRDMPVREELDIVDFVPWRRARFRVREITMPLVMGEMAREMVRFRPDVIHQHFATWSTSAVRGSRAGSIPLMTTVHGGDVFARLRQSSAVPRRGRPMLAWHHRNVDRAFQQSSRVLAVSRFIADAAVRAGVDAHKMEIHYQGVDTEYFSPDSIRRDGGAPVVLFVGALSRAKGLPDLIEASTAIAGRHAHRLHLVGAGPLAALAQRASHDHPHISVLGVLSRDEVRAQMRAADIVVLAAQENNGAREAAGLVLLEAQACGVPVVAYTSGGTPEMLVSGETGLTVPEGDRRALAAAIGDLLSAGETERLAMSVAARAFVVQERSLQRSAEQLEQHYADLAAGRG